jgi:hypothetical protein
MMMGLFDKADILADFNPPSTPLPFSQAKSWEPRLAAIGLKGPYTPPVQSPRGAAPTTPPNATHLFNSMPVTLNPPCDVLDFFNQYTKT